MTEDWGELDHLELHLAIARAEIADGQLDIRIADAGGPTIQDASGRWERFRPSVNWAHAGLVIERQWPVIVAKLQEWHGDGWPHAIGEGRDLLLWFMRAHLASRP